MMTSPVSLSVTICSVEQYRKPISRGMWYFSLKSSIFKGNSTRLSNLPIWANLKIKWLNPIDKERSKWAAEEGSREEKNMFEKKKMYKSTEANVYDSLWYLREDVSKISQERRGVGIICILGKVRRVCVWCLWNLKTCENGKVMSPFTLYGKLKWVGVIPPKSFKKKPIRWICTSPLDVWDSTLSGAFNSALRNSKCQWQVWGTWIIPSHTCELKNRVVLCHGSQNLVFSPSTKGKN